jgi:hypothetical protein
MQLAWLMLLHHYAWPQEGALLRFGLAKNLVLSS